MESIVFKQKVGKNNLQDWDLINYNIGIAI